MCVQPLSLTTIGKIIVIQDIIPDLKLLASLMLNELAGLTQ